MYDKSGWPVCKETSTDNWIKKDYNKFFLDHCYRTTEDLKIQSCEIKQSCFQDSKLKTEKQCEINANQLCKMGNDNSGTKLFTEDIPHNNYKISNDGSVNKQEVFRSIIVSLENLKHLEFSQPKFYNYVEKVLRNCYRAVELNIKFEENEKQEISRLLKKNKHNIDSCIFNLGLCFDENRLPSILVIRSGLQFILDNLKSKEGGISKEFSDYFKKTESLEMLDEAIENWKLNPTISWESIDHSEESLQKPLGIPASHTWWFSMQ